MPRSIQVIAIPIVLSLGPWLCSTIQAGGVQFVDETSTRFPQTNPTEYTNQLTIGDIDGDGVVGVADLLILLGSWGPCPDLPETCPADLDLDGNVGVADLLILLGNWG